MTAPRFLDTLLPHNAKDFIAVYDQNFNQVFPGARPIHATVRETAKAMEHPVEDGTIITDHRIILPVEIDMSLVCQAADYQNAYRQIKQFYLNATLLRVQVKTGVYTDQFITALPHEETPDQYNAVSIALKFKQVLFATTVFAVVPLNPTNQSTVDRGIQNGSTPAAPQQASASNSFAHNKIFQ